MPADDISLVRGCLGNDPGAMRALVDRFQTPVYGLCVRMLGNRHDAEDVTQEVFIRVFRSLKGWDVSRPLNPWVMGIAVNRCRTWLSQRARRPEPVDYLQDTLAGPVADDSTELVREIHGALAELRWEYRTVFILFHEQGQPYEEIALALEWPGGNDQDLAASGPFGNAGSSAFAGYGTG